MKKIVITGPESAGKTTLAQKLATYYQVPLVVEQARNYLEKKQAPQYLEPTEALYTYKDLSEIAKLQNEMEYMTWDNEHRLVNVEFPFLICDTDLLTIKIWAIDVFGKCPEWILQNIHNQSLRHKESLYLLCSPEAVAWEDDPLRENPHDRDRLFKIYEKELNFYKKNYIILRGSVDERLTEACLKITSFIK
jgi:nicotinamide riboside kinase